MKAISKTNEVGNLSSTIEFPILMKAIDSNLVVLFNGRTTGMVIIEDHINKFGKYFDDWTPCDLKEIWQPYQGQIILENK